MARPRVDAVLGALARRRADVSSAHFALACTSADVALASRPDTPVSASSTASEAQQRFAISAPKRQLKRAVDRNALKRVAREAWRLAAWPAGARPDAAMLKLRRSEADWKTMGRAALKKVWRAEIDELVSKARLCLDLTLNDLQGQ